MYYGDFQAQIVIIGSKTGDSLKLFLKADYHFEPYGISMLQLKKWVKYRKLI